MLRFFKLSLLLIAVSITVNVCSMNKKKCVRYTHVRYKYPKQTAKRSPEDLVNFRELRQAIREDQFEEVCDILELIGNLNVGDSCNNPLALAVFHDRLQIAEKLIEKGADVNFAFPTKFVQSAEMLGLLLQNGVNISRSDESTAPVSFSIIKRKRLPIKIKLAMIDKLIEFGVDLNTIYQRETDNLPESALTLSLKEGLVEVSKKILKANADSNISLKDLYVGFSDDAYNQEIEKLISEHLEIV